MERDNFASVCPHSQNTVSLTNSVSLGVATKTQISYVLHYVKNYFNWKQTSTHLKCSTSSSCLVYLLSQLVMCVQRSHKGDRNKMRSCNFSKETLRQDQDKGHLRGWHSAAAYCHTAGAPTDPKGKDSQVQTWVKVHQQTPKGRIHKYKHGSKCQFSKCWKLQALGLGTPKKKTQRQYHF